MTKESYFYRQIGQLLRRLAGLIGMRRSYARRDYDFPHIEKSVATDQYLPLRLIERDIAGRMPWHVDHLQPTKGLDDITIL